MDYGINPSVFGALYSLPAEIADKHLKLAGEAQLKVILYLFRHLSEMPDSEAIALALRMDKSEVEDALLYWASSGILTANIPTVSEPGQKSKIHTKSKILPTREEVGRTAAENPAFRELLAQAQIKFGRLLKMSETSVLLWLLEDEGMSVPVILMLLEYAASEQRMNISFVERTACEWIDAGVSDLNSAEKYIKASYQKKTAWKVVEKAFGIEDRLPSTKELEYADLWLIKWQFDEKMLKAAYEQCVDAKSKFIMSYVAKILEKYHEKGYKTAQDVANGEAVKQKAGNNISTHDIDMIDDLINKGYGDN